MKAHIKAIQQALAPLGWPTPYTDATGVTGYPYVLLWSTPGMDDLEPALGAEGGWSDMLGVTVVDDTALNVLADVQRVRDLLDGATLTVPGRHARLHLQRGLSQTVTVDRAVTIPATNTHPCYVVDRYLLTSQPII